MSEFVKVNGRKNNPTYIFNEKYIYSSYDPYKEATQFITNKSKSDSKVVITICGADFVNELLIKNTQKIVISIDLGLILDGKSDFDNWVDSPKLYRVKTLKQVLDILLKNNITANEIDLLIWTAYISQVEGSKNVLSDIKDICQTATASKVTADFFCKIEQRNARRNIKTLKCFNKLYRQNTDKKTAVIVASGASLPLYMNFLMKNRADSLVVALPSAMKFLQNNKISVDYCIAVDPGYATLYHLNNVKQPIKLICPLSINPAILHIPNIEPVFFDYGNTWDKDYFDDKCVKSVSEGSVCFNAIRIVTQLGCKKAVLLGQDFAFYHNRSHVAGGFFESEYYNKTDYFNSMDKILSSIELKKDPAFLQVGNKKLRSDVTLKIYYQHLLDTKFDIDLSVPDGAFNPIWEL